MLSDPSPAAGAPIDIGRALSGAVLLGAWEAGAGQLPPARALTLLRAGCPSLDPDGAAMLPLTLRDLALVRLHAHSFGPIITATATCDLCAERLEFALPVQQIADSLRAADANRILTRDSVTLRLRLANTRDLMDAAAAADLAAARHLLLMRCTEASAADGQAVALPDSLRDAVLDQLDAMHEAAEIALTPGCPACDSPQHVQLDIASFLWAEVRDAARRLLDEVHELAWAYSWSEATILSMSATRRQAYLERVRG